MRRPDTSAAEGGAATCSGSAAGKAAVAGAAPGLNAAATPPRPTKAIHVAREPRLAAGQKKGDVVGKTVLGLEVKVDDLVFCQRRGHKTGGDDALTEAGHKGGFVLGKQEGSNPALPSKMSFVVVEVDGSKHVLRQARTLSRDNKHLFEWDPVKDTSIDTFRCQNDGLPENLPAGVLGSNKPKPPNLNRWDRSGIPGPSASALDDAIDADANRDSLLLAGTQEIPTDGGGAVPAAETPTDGGGDEYLADTPTDGDGD